MKGREGRKDGFRERGRVGGKEEGRNFDRLRYKKESFLDT